MKKTIFTINYDDAVHQTEFKEGRCNDFGKEQDAFDADLINALAIGLGMKIGIMYHSETARKELLKNVIGVIESGFN